MTRDRVFRWEHQYNIYVTGEMCANAREHHWYTKCRDRMFSKWAVVCWVMVPPLIATGVVFVLRFVFGVPGNVAGILAVVLIFASGIFGGWISNKILNGDFLY